MKLILRLVSGGQKLLKSWKQAWKKDDNHMMLLDSVSARRNKPTHFETMH